MLLLYGGLNTSTEMISPAALEDKCGAFAWKSTIFTLRTSQIGFWLPDFGNFDKSLNKMAESIYAVLPGERTDLN